MFVYGLYSESVKQLYIGLTNNLERRIKEHNSNYSRWTKNKGPWRLIYSEHVGNLSVARRREKLLKTNAGRQFLKEHIEKL